MPTEARNTDKQKSHESGISGALALQFAKTLTIKKWLTLLDRLVM